MNKLSHILFGLSLPLVGLSIIHHPVHYGYKFAYDLRGGANWLVGVFFIFLGIQFLRTIPKGPFKKNIFICPQCQEIQDPHDQQNPACPICHINLEPLSGFYERHPELKRYY